MKTPIKSYWICAMLVLAAFVSHADNPCIITPATNFIGCFDGTLSPGYVFSPTNITVAVGQEIPQPIVSGLSINNGIEWYYYSNVCYPNMDGWYTNQINYSFGNLYFVPPLPQVLWSPGTYYYTGEVVAAGSLCGPFTEDLGTVEVAVTTNDPDLFIDVDFAASLVSAKSGYAAVGYSGSDFWNAYSLAYQTFGAHDLLSGTITNLLTVQKQVSPVGLTVNNFMAYGTNGSADPMYNGYLSTNGGAATLTVTNLPTGLYDIYLYSDDGNFDLQVLDNNNNLIDDFGTANCFNLPVSSPLVWQQGLQYAAYGDIPITNGQKLIVQIAPGRAGVALISGMQIVAAAPAPPFILDQPAGCQTWAGENVTLSVLAGGTPPLTYQWSFNGSIIQGATNAAYDLTNVQISESGNYTVTVSNPYGSVTSSAATLTVNPPPCRPIIYTFNPIMGFPGTNVTITGTNFSSIASNNIVYFGAVRAPVLSATATNLVVTVPAGATFVPITVTENGLAAYADGPFLPTFPGTGGNITASDFASRLDLPVGSGPGQVVVADLDGDGKPDLIVGDSYSGDIYIYRNISTSDAPLSSGSFASPIVLTMFRGTWSDPQTILVSDIDGDGRPDIIAFNSDSHLISIYRNISSPGSLTSASFAPRLDIPVQSTLRNAAIMDVNGDGKPDIITVNGGNPGIVSIFQNDTTNSNIAFAAPVNLSADIQPTSIAIGDLDGDGQPDLVVGTYNGLISIYRNLGTAGNITAAEFATPVDFPCPAQVDAIALGDVDGDGKLDILASEGNTSYAVSVFLNTSTPGQGITTNSFAPVINFGLAGWGNDLTLGDLNGDGKFDVAAATQIGNALSLFQNNSTVGSFGSQSFGSRIDLSSGSNPTGVTIGDLNGDGRPDIIFANQYSGTISIYENVSPASPFIISQPVSETAAQGGTATFTVSAGGASTLSYKWYFNNTLLAGKTTATLTLSDINDANAGAYKVVVSNPEGSTTSSNASLTVVPLIVYAGPNEQVTNQTSTVNITSTQLHGVVFGTGVESYITTWSVISGPTGASVEFANVNLTNTIVTFLDNSPSTVGTYDLRLTATSSDGQWVGSSDVLVTVTSMLDPVSYGDGGYRYAYAAQDIYTNFFETNYFDCDCTWSLGQAGFGNNSGCNLHATTYWPGHDGGYPYFYARKHFYVPPGTTNLSMGFTVDNDAEIYLNGNLVTPMLTTNEVTGAVVQPDVAQAVYNGGNGWAYVYDDNILLTNYFYHSGCCQYDDLILSGFSTNIWHTNDNLLAVRVYDDGAVSFFDSRIFMATSLIPSNQPPLVYAGPNQYVVLPNQASLNGYVADDGLPGTGQAVAYWQEVSGYDNNVQFSPQSTPFTYYSTVNTTASFDAPGTYQLALIAFDGQLYSTSEVTVVVGDGSVPGPTVNFVAPSGGTAFQGTVPITVTATPAQGSTIANVQFYANNNLIGQVTTSPYTMNWLQVPPGSYTLTAVATDSAGRTGSASENINVVNPVQAQGDSYTVFENMATNLAVLANDSDLSGGTLTVAAVTPASHGSLTINPNGTITYAPVPNYLGSDQFTYTASDGAASATATVYITVINPIQAQNENINAYYGMSTNINVLADDSDQNPNGTLRIVSVTPGSHGSVTVGANGELIYTPQSAQLTLMSPSESGFSASSVNINGIVCGTLTLPNNVTHAAIWQIGGGITDLDPNGTYSVAECINNNGVVVGYRQVAGGDYHAFEYNQGQMIDLQNEVAQAVGANDIYTIAWGINNNNQICGQAYTSSGTNQAFFIDNDNQVTVLDSFGGSFIAAYGINDWPLVVGTSSTNDAFLAFTWQPGDSIPNDLGPGFAVPNQFAIGVNNNGDFCGYTALYYNSWAFAVTNGQFADLSSGYWNSWAFAMNSQDQIVGSWDSPQTEYKDRALYWQGGQHYDLNTLLPPGSGWLLTDGVAINENGLIAGIGSYNGNATSFAAYALTTPFQGNDSFTYTITDGTWTNTATVQVTVGDPVQMSTLYQTSFTGMATNLNVLANDSDSSGQTLTIASVTQGASGGSVAINHDGTLTYTPPSPTYQGSDWFSYIASDGTWTNGATVYMYITDPVSAQNYSENTYGGTPMELNVVQGASDASQGTLSITSVTQGANGSVTYDASGNVTYTPAPNFLGSDSFNYTVSDGTWSATATVNVTVVNPIVMPGESTNVFINMSSNLDLLAFDMDENPNGNPLRIVSFTPGSHGSVTLGANGQLIYTPQNMQLSLMSPPSLPAGEQFSVNSVNINGLACGALSLPNNITHAATWQIGGGITDLDPNGTHSVAEGINDNGAVVGYRQIAAGGAYHAFEYSNGQMTDLHNEVAGVNDPNSIASAINNNNQICGQSYNSSGVYQAFFLDQNNNLTTLDSFGGSFINASSINNSPWIVGASQTSDGYDHAFEWRPGSDAVDLSSYFPVPNQYVNCINNNGAGPIGDDICGYTVNNGDNLAFAVTNGVFEDLSPGYLNSWAFALNSKDQIIGAGAVQSGSPDKALYWQNGQNYDLNTLLPSGSGWLLGDAYAINENGLIVGTGTYQGNGTSFATYAPTPSFSGQDSFSYTVTDGTWTNTVTMSITVIDPVTAQNQYPPTIFGNEPTVINVLSGSADQTGGTVTLASVTQGANGSVTINSDGTVTYTPTTPGFNGEDTFTYTVTDGTWSATATVYVDLVPDPVYAANLNAQALSGLATVVPVMYQSYDQDNDPLYIDSVSQGVNGGSITIDADGQTVSYTPPANYTGSDSFTYTLTDGQYANAATVTVNVTQVPLPPVIFNTSGYYGNNPTTVTLSVPGYPNAIIHYQIGEGSWQVYSSPISITSDSTITAYATQSGFMNSGYSAQEFGNPLAPVAAPSYLAVNQGDNELDVLDNDFDPEGAGLTIIDIPVEPQNGTATIESDGTLHYQPNQGFYGIDSFSYTIQSYSGYESTATATVFVNKPGNNAPNADGGSATLQEYTYSGDFEIVTNDSDPDGDSVTLYAISTPPPMGSIINQGNQVAYSRQSAQFGKDTFTYVVTDGNGNFATADEVVDQEDSEQLGFSDEWQEYYFGYIGVDPADDPDGDGLPNIAEYALHTDPLVPDNSLNSLSLPGTVSGTVTIPLGISTDVDKNVSLRLLINGQEADATFQRVDGTWVAQWDTTALNNGSYEMALECDYAIGEGAQVNSVVGAPESVTVNNPLTFNELTKSFTSMLVIDAAVNVPATSYTVDIYDYRTGTYLTTLSGQVSGGQIETSWNLQNAQGNQIVDGPVYCIFSLTAGQSPSGSNGIQPAGSASSWGAQASFFYVADISGDLSYTPVYGYENYTGSMQNGLGNLMLFDVVNILDTLYDDWGSGGTDYNLLPNGPGGNVPYASAFRWYPNRPSTVTLLQALGTGANLYWWGHGNPTLIAPHSGNPNAPDFDPVPMIDQQSCLSSYSVAKILENNKTRRQAQHPYKLAILDCCEAYSRSWASAFGMSFWPNGDNFTVADYQSVGRDPQAFVAYIPIEPAPVNLTELSDLGAGEQVLHEEWQLGYSIQQCFYDYTRTLVSYGGSFAQDGYYDQNGNPFPPPNAPDGIPDIEQYMISGCVDLTTYDR